jgi:hypothetical protein
MFAALGEETGFCRWVARLGGQATLAAPTSRGGWAGAALLYLRASLLHAGAGQASVRTTVAAARRDGALLALRLDDASWIRDRGGPQTAYELAALRPDIMFATEAAAAELGVPLEGIASVPVTMLESGGCTVHGRRVLAAGAGQDRDALAAAFCAAFLEGAAPVEAAGRAVLVAAR